MYYQSSVHATIDSGKKNDGSLNSNGQSFFRRVMPEDIASSELTHAKSNDVASRHHAIGNVRGSSDNGAESSSDHQLRNSNKVPTRNETAQGVFQEAEELGILSNARNRQLLDCSGGRPVIGADEDFRSLVESCLAEEGCAETIGCWDTSRVTNMTEAFYDAKDFNQPLDSWDVSSVTDMWRMFRGASSFNQPLDSWDVSIVTDMGRMFNKASSFNQPLALWDVSSVISMWSMFSSASSFNQPLASWDVSSVTSINSMFFEASSFNQPLDSWDVSSVTNMRWMFDGASSFNQPLALWDVSSVIIMWSMFDGASSFNQPLASWDVSSVTSMTWMFDGALSFNQCLGAWEKNIDSSTRTIDMLRNSGCPNDSNEWCCLVTAKPTPIPTRYPTPRPTRAKATPTPIPTRYPTPRPTHAKATPTPIPASPDANLETTSDNPGMSDEMRSAIVGSVIGGVFAIVAVLVGAYFKAKRNHAP